MMVLMKEFLSTEMIKNGFSYIILKLILSMSENV
jgi:hypothetical protein